MLNLWCYLWTFFFDMGHLNSIQPTLRSAVIGLSTSLVDVLLQSQYVLLIWADTSLLRSYNLDDRKKGMYCNLLSLPNLHWK